MAEDPEFHTRDTLPGVTPVPEGVIPITPQGMTIPSMIGPYKIESPAPTASIAAGRGTIPLGAPLFPSPLYTYSREY